MNSNNTPFNLFGCECGKGWYPLIEPVVDKANAEGASILQIKEKFGTLRIYLGGASNELFDMALEAEEKSETTCENCGAPGTLRTDMSWWKTLCDKCNSLDLSN